MTGIPVRLGLAAVALLAGCAFSSGEAAAVTIQSFSFDGTVIDVTDPSDVTGIHLADHITGSITFSPIVNDPTFNIGFASQFDETGSFTFSGPTSGPFTAPDGSTGSVSSSALFGSTSLTLAIASGDKDLQINFGNAGFYVLDHLSSLPGDALSLASILGAGLHGGGTLNYQDAFLQFEITTSVATTPIPATLWLFASALGSLGLLGWTRRRQAAALMANEE